MTLNRILRIACVLLVLTTTPVVAQQRVWTETGEEVSGWEFVARWRPAREVAGDYYDFIPRDDGQLSLVIADAAGKGMPAALFMARTSKVIQTIGLQSGSQFDTLVQTNE